MIMVFLSEGESMAMVLAPGAVLAPKKSRGLQSDPHSHDLSTSDSYQSHHRYVTRHVTTLPNCVDQITSDDHDYDSAEFPGSSPISLGE